MPSLSLLPLLVLLAARPAASGEPDPAIVALLKSVDAAKGDRVALGKALAEAEAMCQQGPSNAHAHFVRGYALSKLSRFEDAATAYLRALALDPGFAEAAYNAGVVRGGQRREADAAKLFDQAFAADPKHVDAAYNAGQAFYNLKDYAKALARWKAAQALDPQNFDIAKKVLQCHRALGQEDAARAARDRVFQLRNDSAEPRVRELRDYVFDQFEVDALHVYAYETFAPLGPDAVVYSYRAADKRNAIRGQVQLQKAPGGYALAFVPNGQPPVPTGKTWSKLPAVTELKPVVSQVIREKLGR